MILACGLLIASAVAIYVSCEFFVNGIEWVGRKFKVSGNATGSVLAAFGTALPESVITFMAVVFGDGPAQKELGVGAAIGGPLVLATIAYAVVGLTFMLNTITLNTSLFSISSRLRLIRDQKWFMSVFVVKILLGLIAFSIKPLFGILFLIAYALYVRQEMQADFDAEVASTPLEPLKIRKSMKEPSTAWVLIQTGGALAVIFYFSQLFVHQLNVITPWLGLPPQIVALFLSPIATELPEIMNAVIWVRQGKQNLALANISGAMMIQATVPSALAIFFTPWLLGPILVWAAVVTMGSIVGLYILMKQNRLTGNRLAWFGVLYLVFIAGTMIKG